MTLGWNLQLLAAHEATVLNSWFEKREIHKQTWMHPRSRQWHCIDYCIMRQRDRAKCLDVTVKRGAECNTDHQLLCAKVKVCLKRIHQRKPHVVRKLDVSPLAPTDSESEVREAFQAHVEMKAASGWPSEGAVEEKWAVLKEALLDSATACLPVLTRHNPDWFKECASDLQPSLSKRNKLYVKWLATKKSDDYMHFKQARGAAQRAIRQAKNKWFTAKAEEAEKERFGGKKVWKCIRDLQRGRRGLCPLPVTAIHDENNNPCNSP